MAHSGWNLWDGWDLWDVMRRAGTRCRKSHLSYPSHRSHDTVRKHSNYQPNQERKQIMKKTLAEAIKGMQVKNWEMREHSDGKRVVYVRFTPKEPSLTMNVKGE